MRSSPTCRRSSPRSSGAVNRGPTRRPATRLPGRSAGPLNVVAGSFSPRRPVGPRRRRGNARLDRPPPISRITVAWSPPRSAGRWPQGCKMLSDRLTHWHMLDQEALEDPIKAVGGDAVVFAPQGDDAAARRGSARHGRRRRNWSPTTLRSSSSSASTPPAQPHPYPPEYDQIGEARLRPRRQGRAEGVRRRPADRVRHLREAHASAATTTSSSPTPPGIRPTRA